jgi:ubiquitin C-terminal hydrolase
MHEEPLTSVHIPWLMTHRHYRGHQEDAAEFIAQQLVDPDGSPCVSQCLRALDAPMLVCATCDAFSRPATEEPFTTLAAPLLSPTEPHKPLGSVQAALDAFFVAEPMAEGTAWACGNAACRSTDAPRKRHVLKTPPPVLCITLNRWRGHQVEHALLHHVHPNLEVTLNASSYVLRSIVVHLGSSPRGGHYVAVAHHATSTGNWWLYNDAIRREARPAELARTAHLQGNLMKAYVLFYELQRAS